MDCLICGLSSFADAYIDGPIVFSSTWEEHVALVCAFLRRLCKAGLTVKLQMCQFGIANSAYLGHVVDGVSLCPKQSKSDAVQSM